MLWKAGKKRQGDEGKSLPARPTALTLIARMFTALVSDGMRWLSIPAALVIIYLRYNHVENDALTALVLGGLGALAVIRGCKAWQKDLNDYQRHLSLARHREEAAELTRIPGSFPSQRY